jgi:hypothetical protein
MTNSQDKLVELLNSAGLQVSKVKSLPEQVPTQDIVEQLQMEQGLNILSAPTSKVKDDFLGRKTTCNAKFNKQIVSVTFNYKKVKGRDVNDLENAEKTRYALYIDKKFNTDIYFTQLAGVKQFEMLVKFNEQLFVNDDYSAYHFNESWKLPTQFQTDLGRNKCLAWTSNSGVPLIIPTITMCQNYDNSTALGGTPFSRPNYRIQKSQLDNEVKIGYVHRTDTPIINPTRWTTISQSLSEGNPTQYTNDEINFLTWYNALRDKAIKANS